MYGELCVLTPVRSAQDGIKAPFALHFGIHIPGTVLLVFRSMSVHNYMLAWKPRAVVFKDIPSMDHIFTVPDIKHSKTPGRQRTLGGWNWHVQTLWLDLGQHRFRGQPLCRKISFLLSEYRTSRVRLRCWHTCEQRQQSGLLQCQSLPATPVSRQSSPSHENSRGADILGDYSMFCCQFLCFHMANCDEGIEKGKVMKPC